MKSIITTFLAIFSCFILIAQPGGLKKIEHTLFLGQEDMTVSDFFEYINVDKDKFFNNHSIDEGTIYYIREFETFSKLSFSTTWFDYMLLVDNSNDKILFSTVAISGVKSANNEDIFKQYHSSFSKYLAEHEAFYDVAIDLADENMSPLNNFVFGTGCGWEGPLPQKGMEMLEYVKKGDDETLVKWLKSMNPAIQSYAVMGLHFMKKKGKEVKLKRKDEKLLEYVKNKKTIIDYCSNIELNATTPMNAVLNDFYLDTIWDLYKDNF